LAAALAGSGSSGSSGSSGGGGYGGLPAAAVVAATRALVPLVACAEGRALLLQHGGPAQLVAVLRGALAAARRRRHAAAERATAVLRLLAAATLHGDLQRALLQVPDFSDFLAGAVELFGATDKGLVDRAPNAAAPHAQPTARYAAAAAHLSGAASWRDPLAAAGVRELCALLVRNVARHRANRKGARLAASPAVLEFLLRSLCPRDTHAASAAQGGVPLRVAAACSAALWSLLHHSAKAAPALRQLHADAPVAAALLRCQHLLAARSTVVVAAPSVQRAAHHLAMVQLLLARPETIEA
jgi:hypothetical protein